MTGTRVFEPLNHGFICLVLVQYMNRMKKCYVCWPFSRKKHQTQRWLPSSTLKLFHCLFMTASFTVITLIDTFFSSLTLLLNGYILKTWIFYYLRIYLMYVMFCFVWICLICICHVQMVTVLQLLVTHCYWVASWMLLATVIMTTTMKSHQQ